MGITVIALDRDISARTVHLRARHTDLRLPDAMVLATAHLLRGPLLTYDQKLRRYAGEEMDESKAAFDPELPRR